MLEAQSPVPEVTVKDFIGNVIKPDTIIAYPVRRGSSMWLNTLKVSQVREDKLTGYNKVGRLIHVTNLSNVVVVVTPPKPTPETTTDASV